MENQTRWVASWVDLKGRERTYIFRGPENRIQARIELTIKLFDQHEPLPQGYEFEEVEAGVPTTPALEGGRISRGPPRRTRLVQLCSHAGAGGFS